MSAREKGMIIVVPLAGLLTVSAVAFFLIDPLRQFSQDNPGVWATLPETIAVALFVGGAESALLILLPIKYNDGENVWGWNKMVWLLLAVPAMFMFFHAIVNDEEIGALVGDEGTLTLMIIALLVLAIALATWLYFRLRERRLAA